MAQKLNGKTVAIGQKSNWSRSLNLEFYFLNDCQLYEFEYFSMNCMYIWNNSSYHRWGESVLITDLKNNESSCCGYSWAIWWNRIFPYISLSLTHSSSNYRVPLIWITNWRQIVAINNWYYIRFVWFPFLSEYIRSIRANYSKNMTL